MTEYLIDTNILIYYPAGALTPEEKPTVDKILQDSFNISIITKIELLGWKGHTTEGLIKARYLLDCARCLPLTDTLAEKTIETGVIPQSLFPMRRLRHLHYPLMQFS